MPKKLAVPLVLVMALCSCSETPRKIKFASKANLGLALTYNYTQPTRTNYFKYRIENAGNPKAERNRVIFELMGLIDSEFSQFERHLRSDRALKDTFATWTSIALTAGAAITGGDTGKILSAIDTGFKGANEAVDKNIFKDYATEALLNQMNTKRSELAAQIYQSMTNTIEVYPMEAAIRDLERYHNEGYVTPAIVALFQTTGIESRSAATNAAELRLKIR